jgi:hypothetical protein
MNASGVLNNDAQRISPAFLPNYLSSQGTSFACPHVSGVVALMLEANPLLTPADVVTILRQTATPMPYEERVVGAGYVDAHNAVRAVMSLTAVPHPANLFRQPGDPEIFDVEDDQLGTTAQDIRTGRFAYDVATNQIVYTLTLTDLSVITPNMRWTMTSTFGTTDVFVTASSDELATSYRYGTITTLATGTRNQQNLGPADSGEITGNTIVIRLALDKVNAAVGSDVLYTTSRNTQAQAQILIGSSVSGGLLLNADSASGADFKVGAQPDPTPTPTPESTPTPSPEPTPSPTPDPTGCPAEGKFKEAYSGTLAVGQSSTDIAFSLRRSSISVKIKYQPKSERLTLQLLNSSGQVIAASEDGSIDVGGLTCGDHIFRVVGPPASNPVDFTIRSVQGLPHDAD